MDNVPPKMMFLMLPLGFSAVVISVIYGLRSAIFVGLFVSGIASVALGNSFSALLTGLLVSGIAGFAVRYSADYKKFFAYTFLSCWLVTTVSGIVFLGADLMEEGIFSNARLLILLPILGAICTAVCALAVLTVFELFPGVTTNMTFLTYTDRNHPLLKRLQMEAPGTYHHCERVASIAEKAATSIGCDPWKVQACALFHDIGKLSAPGMFTENAEGINTHEKLTPEESAAIIRKHVTYGLELARKYKLKRSLREAIACHHGTSFISFFYQMEQKLHPDETISEEKFRYNGPLPQDKENTILMLADCCEAALRSCISPTPDEIY